MGCDVETNIIHISIFSPALSPGAYVAEHTYVKCSDATAQKIVDAIANDGETMVMSLHTARFVCYMQSGALQEFGEYTAVRCSKNPPTLDMFLLNGVQNGLRLTHIICFLTDQDGYPVESSIYKLGELRTMEAAKL